MLEIRSDFLTVNLNKLVALMQSRAEKILNTEYGITYSQFLVLHTINTLHSPTQQNISVCLNITGAGISKIIEKLLPIGFITREVNVTNRRANIIQLTKKGKRIIDSALQRLEKEFDKKISVTDKKIMSDITNTTIVNLLKTYEK